MRVFFILLFLPTVCFSGVSFSDDNPYSNTTSDSDTSSESTYDENGIPYGEVQSIENLYLCKFCGIDIFVLSDSSSESQEDSESGSED